MASLTVSHVNKRFGKTEVLKDINLEVAQGEFIVLVGPSGCGKSTLLNIIAGLEELSEGEVRIGGRLVNRVPPKNRNIAMVFQTYALYPTMTARENIAFGLSIRKVPKEEQEKQVQRVAKMLQIVELLDRKPAHLSGGQRQRVAMGRALAREPEIFLFDEPLSNLDAKLRVEMREEIKNLHKTVQTTIVYVTHDQVEAMTLADRIAIMRNGVIQQLADPTTVYEKPANLFVAGFIGSPAMNIVPGLLKQEGGQIVAHIEGTADLPSHSLPLPGDAARYADWVGADLLLGLRPEHIIAAEGSGGTAFHPISSQVRFLEPTGPDTLVFTSLGAHRVVARVVPSTAQPEGSSMDFHVDLSHLLLFDPKTEQRIVLD